MNLPQEFTELLDECSRLIDDSGLLGPQERLPSAEPLPSLLERCDELVRREGAVEPIRTIHHFACTGGTLFSKCLASMPNVQLLSEVAPYSTLDSAGGADFRPTDLIVLLRSSSRGSNSQLEIEVFRRGIEAIYRHYTDCGVRLVIREHSHSKYCIGEAVLDTPPLFDVLKTIAPVRSVVMVRHPLDAYLSLVKSRWLTFQPESLEEYAKRYLRFLSDHDGTEVIRYEDFVQDPEGVMQKLCHELELPYAEDFTMTFYAHTLSGDSGRSSGRITKRERRPIPEELEKDLQNGRFTELCEKLAYSV